MQISGLLFLLGYVIFLGVGTFLQKLSMKELSPYQLHFLIAIGMLITAIPILYFTQHHFKIPMRGIPLGSVVGLLFAIGSLFFTLSLSKLPVGSATAISLSYIVIVFILSALFLKEEITLLKVTGVLLTLTGVGILSYQTQS